MEQAFGPAGSDIFAPEKMYGYLNPEATFGELPPDRVKWDPQELPENVFSAADVFCLIGTDPKDYGLPRVAVGPKSDGLVLIEHAYVRKAHRGFVYRSHSGTYGEVNSEEGYQNLRRFLFGRWEVGVDLEDLPPYPGPGVPPWPRRTRRQRSVRPDHQGLARRSAGSPGADPGRGRLRRPHPAARGRPRPAGARPRRRPQGQRDRPDRVSNADVAAACARRWPPPDRRTGLGSDG